MSDIPQGVDSQPIDLPPPVEQESAYADQNNIPDEKERVEITETPTGWLNVRKGPDTEFEIITKISPGETYQLLEEEDNWYRISLNDGTDGWISGEYAKKAGRE